MRSAGRVLGEIERLEWRAVTLLHEREKLFAEIISVLREEAVRDRDDDRLLRSAAFF